MSDDRPADVHNAPAAHSSTRPPRADDGEPVGAYVEPPSPLQVQVRIRGELLSGHVEGWRGERVFVRYRTAIGSHLAWLPAAGR